MLYREKKLSKLTENEDLNKELETLMDDKSAHTRGGLLCDEMGKNNLILKFIFEFKFKNTSRIG